MLSHPLLTADGGKQRDGVLKIPLAQIQNPKNLSTFIKQ